MKTIFALVLLSGLFVLIGVQHALAQTQTRVGISANFGLGVFVSQNRNAYLGIKTDLYPEAGVQLDLSLLRLGLKAGLIYRKSKILFFDPRFGNFEESFTIAFVPIQAEILLAPLDAIDPDTDFSPYFGLMGGVFVAAGDNDETVGTVSFKLGSELRLASFAILFGDIRYTFADFDAAFEDNLGGVIVMAGLGIRLGRG